MSKSPLISICIPTYNRAEILRNTLNKLVSSQEYDSNLVEIIVSDNSSTDNTQEVVSQFPLVKYFKQEVNIGDENFYRVLSYGSGLYLKLCNDTVYLNEGKLSEILELIEQNIHSNTHIMFFQNSRFLSDSNLEINSESKFLSSVSYFSTWIANFGCWRSDFVKIMDPLRFVNLSFSQVDWTYKIIGSCDKCILYADDFFVVQDVNKKGGYNLFQVFGVNYFEVLKPFNFSFKLIQKEKYRVFKYFLLYWIRQLIIKQNTKFTYESNEYLKVLLINYKYQPYFYVFIGWSYLQRFFYRVFLRLKIIEKT